MNEMEELYREIILDHNKRPRNFHAMADATHHADGHNPLCGDEIEVFVKWRTARSPTFPFRARAAPFPNRARRS
jgi:NifU-like protein involved in Fe-S cluster formation